MGDFWSGGQFGWAIACSILMWSLGMTQLPFDATTRANAAAWPDTAVVEWLEFQMPASEREDFIERDERVWTEALREHPGFLHKSVWTSPERPESVVFAIYWASREDWSAFPEAKIEDLDRQMQPTNAELIDAKEFNVRHPAFASAPDLEP